MEEINDALSDYLIVRLLERAQNEKKPSLNDLKDEKPSKTTIEVD